MNSWRHARSSARRWGGDPESYLEVHEFIDSSKQTLGDVRHRALYHHTLGVWLCQKIFGPALRVPRKIGTRGGHIEVPTREVAERHIIEDLGFLPTPEHYLRNTPVELWMSGSRRREVPPAHLFGADAPNHREEEEDHDE